MNDRGNIVKRFECPLVRSRASGPDSDHSVFICMYHFERWSGGLSSLWHPCHVEFYGGQPHLHGQSQATLSGGPTQINLSIRCLLPHSLHASQATAETCVGTSRHDKLTYNRKTPQVFIPLSHSYYCGESHHCSDAVESHVMVRGKVQAERIWVPTPMSAPQPAWSSDASLITWCKSFF